MGQVGRYKTPDELRDEDRWFKFFTLPQLAAACAIAAADALLIALAKKAGIVPAGICAALLLTALAGVLLFLRMPRRRYLMGGGLPLYEVARRVIAKKMPSRRVLYVKAGTDLEDEDSPSGKGDRA